MFLNNTTFANIVVWVWGCGCENWILKSRLQQIKWLVNEMLRINYT